MRAQKKNTHRVFHSAQAAKSASDGSLCMTTSHRVQVTVAIAALTLAFCTPASAQKITEVEGLTLAGALGELVGPLGSRPAAEALGLATALEIATTPFGTSSGGFVFRLDPATGLLARTATTFGPSFAERALTSGEGQVSIGASFSAATYKQARRSLSR